MNRYWPMLFLLAAIWGASYLFIKVAVDEIAPAPMMAARTLIAAAVLVGYVLWRYGRPRALEELGAAWRHCLVLGVLNAALPFWLIAWGEQHIDSGLAAVVQASVPIFNALLILRFLPHEKLSRTRALGLAIGIVGVAVVTGIHPEGGSLAVLGALAVVLSSLSYAGAGVYGQRAVSGTAGPVLAAGSMLVGALILTPFALFQLPSQRSLARGDRVGAGARTPRYRVRAARALPDARPPRLVAPLARHLPDAGLRAPLRRAPARRADHGLDAGRPRPDPRWHLARLRRAAPASARSSGNGRALSVSIRPATDGDVDFLTDLYTDEDVRPFLAASGSYDRAGIAEKVAQDPDSGGVMVVELEGEQAGAMVWEVSNRRSRIVHVSGLAVHPRCRGRRLADDAARLLQHHLIRERGFHRIELEIYAFNERAQRHAERSGFSREGVKRSAYRRGDDWVDSVLYAVVEEDLDEPR